MDLAPCPANRKDDFILSLVQGNWQIRSTFWDCDYSSHRKTFGTAITRPTEKGTQQTIYYKSTKIIIFK